MIWLFGYLPNLVCCCVIALTAGLYSVFGSDEGVSALGNNFIGIVIVFPIQFVVTVLASLLSAAPGLVILSKFNAVVTTARVKNPY